ncbi:hypothetical protein ABZV67_37280 [Streptomyces sp. NPDC005065]|uniref:hypothetical protein n=1 Tax=unclassified Streptomyces TaxID=2593676 RepID=UPI00339EC8D7
MRRHAGLGLCSACWQKNLDRPFIATENLAARLAEPVPWLGDFAGHLADRHCVGRACTMISTLGRLLDDEHPNHPQALLDRARRPGRSMGSLARALEGFFTQRDSPFPPTTLNGSPPDADDAASKPPRSRCDCRCRRSPSSCFEHVSAP